MTTPDHDTLHDTELRWKPTALWFVVAAHGLAALLLAVAAGRLRTAAWVACALPSLVFTALNLRCLAKNGPGVGEMPVAVFALTPALLAGGLALSRIPRHVCLALLPPCAAVCTLFAYWFWRISRSISKPDEVEPNATLIVLGGLIRGGKPVPTVQARIQVAASLWKASPQRTIVLTGGPTPDGSTTEAEAMAAWAESTLGVDASSWLLEKRAVNTQQNLARSIRLAEMSGHVGRQICVVSSDYHLYRALVYAREAGVEAIGIPTAVPITSRLQQWCREVLTILAKRVW